MKSRKSPARELNSGPLVRSPMCYHLSYHLGPNGPTNEIYLHLNYVSFTPSYDGLQGKDYLLQREGMNWTPKAWLVSKSRQTDK